MLDDHTEHDRAFHEATAHLYEATLLPMYGVYEERVTPIYLDRLLAGAPGRRALDLACGTGLLSMPLLARGCTVMGVDHSPAMMAVLAEKAAVAGVADRLELLEGDIRSLPFEPASYDLAVCRGVIHHLEDRDQQSVFAELARVLVPGGTLYISEPCLGDAPPRVVWNVIRRTKRALFGARRVERATDPVVEGVELEIPDHDEGPVDAAAMVARLEQAGFACTVEHWSSFDGMHHVGRRLHRAIVVAASRPWRHRKGDLVYVIGVRR